MSRKRFRADISVAKGQTYQGISNLNNGEEDGEIMFHLNYPNTSPIGFQLLATDVNDYPMHNSFYVCTTTDDAPHDINLVAEELQSLAVGLTIHQILMHLIRLMGNVSADSDYESFTNIKGNGPSQTYDSEDEQSLCEDDDISSFEGSDEYWPDDNDTNTVSAVMDDIRMDSVSADKLNAHIRNDLLLLKAADYSFGILMGMRANHSKHILSVSVRISSLKLSEEALQAWDLDPDHHLVLLIRFSNGYITLEKLLEEPCIHLQKEADFRVGSYSSQQAYAYKPTLSEAIAAFDFYIPETSSAPQTQDACDSTTSGFKPLFIAGAINEFFNSHFFNLFKIRCRYDCSWDDAVEYLHSQSLPKELNVATVTDAVPSETDHLAQSRKNAHVSVPLVAMQFLQRYLVRCTEFCLVCHRLVGHEFDALKPYVCSRPLCLYQYMSLGFGPAVEHEILVRPHVVDLLIGLCYTAAKAGKLREFPTGMNLMVPRYQVPLLESSASDTISSETAALHEAAIRSHLFNPKPSSTILDGSLVFFDAKMQVVKLSSPLRFHVIRPGDWIMLEMATSRLMPDCVDRTKSKVIHVRVLDYAYPFIYVAQDCVVTNVPKHVPANDSLKPIFLKPVPTTLTSSTIPCVYLPTSELGSKKEISPTCAGIPAHMSLYSYNFDELSNAHKYESITVLLDLLPSVKEMRTYLQTSPHSILRKWTDRIPSAASGLLRWIIASNRSFIMQIDGCPGQEASDIAKLRLDDRVSGMDDYIQFRFAQGAPDKEMRFNKALSHSTQKLQPTIFAWHGSPTANWHSIIRQGLDYSVIANGRAHGDGVYHAQDLAVSLSYCRPVCELATWPQAELRIEQALCINEIVNAPEQFRSSNPYLVVQHVDWIQCRYLCVKHVPLGVVQAKPIQPPQKSNRAAIVDVLEQDEKLYLRNGGKKIDLPRCAFRRSIRAQSADNGHEEKRRKLSKDRARCSESKDDMDPLDMQYIEPVNDLPQDISTKSKMPASKAMSSHTDFIPGSLDHSTLPMICEPELASPSATKALNRELKAVLKAQAQAPLHELGWYIDADLVSNIYQWIIEFHSFDSQLPLAKDMKKAKITSIVCEVRFPTDFPNSPPFVRFIRPRFLPFQAGGGGNITIGGAICMELLTNTGWSPANCMESVFLQVRLQIAATDRPARLLSVSAQGAKNDYEIGEAVEAYIRFCKAHGWTVPKDFKQFSTAVPVTT